ncbi:MAG: fused MFS/spermidine synthase [Oligoflexales bacterium]
MQNRLWLYLVVLTLLSGVSSLIYEMLWIKHLSFVLGNSATTSAVVLSAFFFGLACGNLCFAKFLRDRHCRLRTYGIFELGIALGGCVFVLFYQNFYSLLSPTLEIFPINSAWYSIAKFLVAGFFVWLPSFFMGGTLPVLVGVIANQGGRVQNAEQKLYAWNTGGAIVGAVLGAFYLPPLLGYSGAYGVALGINVALAMCAFLWDRSNAYDVAINERQLEALRPSTALVIPKSFGFLAFLSGFGALALESLWHQMFSLVTINCVYSFAIVLVTFLAGLALGAPLATKLGRNNALPNLRKLLWAIAAFSALTPYLFHYLTDGLSFIYQGKDWTQYIFSLFGLAGGVVLFPVVLLGMVLPFLLQSDRTGHEEAGRRVGKILGLNTVGGIFGVLAGGLLLSRLPHPIAVSIVASFYGVGALVIGGKVALIKRLFPTVLTVAGVSGIVFLSSKVPTYHHENDEKILDILHGPHGVVAVAETNTPIDANRQARDLFVRLNNFYTLGGIGALASERRQGELPLFLAKNVDSVFVLGLGTGITAGATLQHPLKELVVAELVPEVTQVAKEYFGPYLNGLFDDPRATVCEEDGRSFLAADSKRYDAIISDLFDPWGASTGTLYSLEHFASIKNHLNDDGIFVQWLPLYQLTEAGFGIIARTMLAAFPQVVIWRGNFDTAKPVLALVGYNKESRLDPLDLEQKILRRGNGNDEGKMGAAEIFVSMQPYSDQFLTQERKNFFVSLFPKVVTSFPYGFYVGNLTLHKDKFKDFPVNTLDKPVFSYLTPRTIGNEKAEADVWLTGNRLGQLLDFFRSTDTDPYLSGLTTQQKQYVDAGHLYLKYSLALAASQTNDDADQLTLAKNLFEEYKLKSGLLRSE